MIAPDLLGYGDTSKPTEVAAYDNTIMAKHVIEILTVENASNVIGVAHDWGSTFLSTIARMFPTHFKLFIFITLGYWASQGPYTTSNIVALDEEYKKAIGRPIHGYWHFFNDPDAVSVIENGNVS